MSDPKDAEAPVAARGAQGLPKLENVLLYLPALAVAVFWCWPKPAMILELPVVVVANDERPRAIVDQDTDQFREHEALMRRAALSEAGEIELQTDHRARAERLAALVQSLDETERAKLRDFETAQVLAWLPRAASAERRGIVGGVVDMLTRVGAVEEGRVVAPIACLHAFLHARWNGLHGLALTDGMSELRQRAYFGWAALHTEWMAAEERLAALERYRLLGGPRVLEARAGLFLQVERYDLAIGALQEAYRNTANLRLRNHIVWLAENASRVSVDEGAMLDR